MPEINFSSTRQTLKTNSGEKTFFSLAALEQAGFAGVSRLPFSIKILLESALRNHDGFLVTDQHVSALANWSAKAENRAEIPFIPARILLQDFTGVPVLVDLAAMRSALHRLGGDPGKIQPKLPVDLVVDHSVQVDYAGVAEALKKNVEREFERNQERYQFLKWGQRSIDGLRVVPPETGIVHQVNLEYLAPVVFEKKDGDRSLVYPDSVVGTDSHTPMINGLGVLGWGVGGLEAESTMLGQPMYMLAPDVIGFKLTGALPAGATATDLVLTITEILRRRGVVGKFVEFFGSGLSSMSLPDRATISNMSPEQGATVGYFPIDSVTLEYMRLTGRSEELIDLTERYAKEQGLFRSDQTPDPEFTDTLEFDLSIVEPSLAGPRNPHERRPLVSLASSFNEALNKPVAESGFAVTPENTDLAVSLKIESKGGASEEKLRHGAVVIAAITSCTNTSNPSVMLAAGLLAQKAVARGLQVPSYVKTSLTPGSQVVTEYLRRAKVLPALEKLGFHVAAYGCATCIGNSGPLAEEIEKAIVENDLIVAAVLSGNRNFEGRVSPLTRANYLASPPLVVAYALAGSVTVDLATESLGDDVDGQAVYLKDIWPGADEIKQALEKSVSSELFSERYADVWTGGANWQEISGSDSQLYPWDDSSTYIHEPPFFTELTTDVPVISPLSAMRCLALLGDIITTDHISPAGSIPADGPAGKYLQSLGVTPRDFNSFGSRRGNDRVMIRGTFANIRLKNKMVAGTEGGYTKYYPSGEQTTIYEAAMKYQCEGRKLIVIGGKAYGTGSSRDWAAKGTYLLGVRAVLAESFERIHRSNLVGMGVLPLVFVAGESAASFKLDGSEEYDLLGLDDNLQPGQELTLGIKRSSGESLEITVIVRLDTPVEVEYYRQGGILHTALRAMAS